jgi:hypothetical protein
MTTITGHTTRATGTVLTAAIYNFDHTVHIANAMALNADKLEGALATTFDDDDFFIRDNIDPTKRVAFQLSGVTTGQTRVITIPDADGIMSLGGTTPVSSFEGRTGAVVSAAGDYTAAEITNVAAGNIAAVTVQAAINELDTEKQPLDTDLTAIAALTTTASGRSVLTHADPNLDQLYMWDDSAGAGGPAALANILTEAAPAAGDFVIIYGAEGDTRKVNWSLLPGSSGGITAVVQDTAPVLGGNLSLGGFTITGMVIGTNIQAFSQKLVDIAALTATDSNFIVGNGTTWVAETGATARTSMGLGTGDSPEFAGINIGAASDTTITRISAGNIAVEGNELYRAGGNDMPVADGGTGRSSSTAFAPLFGGTTTTAAHQSGTPGTAGQVLKSGGASAVGAYADDLVAIQAVFDGGGVALTTGVKLDLPIPFACTIVEWTILADQSGSIQFDIWKDTFANYPPTIADTIVASAKPLISAATKAQSSTLTGWTTAIAANDTLRFNIDSVTSITRATLSLKVRRL